MSRQGASVGRGAGRAWREGEGVGSQAARGSGVPGLVRGLSVGGWKGAEGGPSLAPVSEVAKKKNN